MLTELRIRNYAIIESVSLRLMPGFNVLTGETGAGKSIIVGALGLLLGERGTADLVRSGADRASIEGVFDASSSPHVSATLESRGVPTDEQIVLLRREIASGGKGRAWINDTPVTAGTLAEVGRLLVNLHGQHEAQTLLSPDAQMAMIDAYAGAADCVRRVETAHASLASVRRQIATLTSRREEISRRADYLRHVIREIGDLNLTEGEDERLADEARRLGHAEALREHLARVQEIVDGRGESALAQLASARKSLTVAERLDPTLSASRERLEATLVELEELVRELVAYQSDLDSDPERLGRIERRREAIHRVTRKYGGGVDEAAAALAAARQELDVLDTADLDLKSLTSQEREAQGTLEGEAAELTGLRKRAAASLTADVDALLPALGLPDGKLTVMLSPLAEIGASGAERIEFLVALNVGHEARPLARVASGGELSRIMLALKTILTRLDDVPTLVFDEVDSGIGGAVAQRVGLALERLAGEHQVLVITHLAQIAARATCHIVVEKGAQGGVTTADIRLAEGDERVGELARMLDGDPTSAVSRAHARELLDAAAPSAPRQSERASRGRAKKR